MNKSYDTVEKVQPNMIEAAYRGNIGFMELAEFYQKATSAQIVEMEKIAANSDWVAFKKLIKQVTGRNLM